MSLFQAYSCDAITGKQLDRIPMSAFSYARLLSAGGQGAVTVPLDGTHTRSQLQGLLQHWSRIIVIERDGKAEYGGYALNPRYQRGVNAVSVGLGDFWSLMGRRGSWDHSAANVEKWSTTVGGPLAIQASAALARARDTGPSLPAAGFPVEIPGYGGPDVSRTYYGYHRQTLDDLFSDLLDEGLDAYFRPRWRVDLPGQFNWLWLAGTQWGSGTTHEFYVTAQQSEVVAFSEDSDGLRITNHAHVVGEGTEQDLLVRSTRDASSPYPLLERVTPAKNISNVSQLAAMSVENLRMYSGPTVQWEFTVVGSHPVDVGDTVRLHFDGDPWIADGWHSRRVVKVSANMPGPDVKVISVQPVGGA